MENKEFTEQQKKVLDGQQREILRLVSEIEDHLEPTPGVLKSAFTYLPLIALYVVIGVATIVNCYYQVKASKATIASCSQHKG